MSAGLDSDKGFLRIRINFHGKQKYLYLNAKDTTRNRAKSQPMVDLINFDLESGTFDPTLAKYKISQATGRSVLTLTVVEAYLEWLEQRKNEISQNSYQSYKAFAPLASSFFKKTQARDLTKSTCLLFAEWLNKQALASSYKKLIVTTFCFAWQWLELHNYVLCNPWRDISSLIKSDKKKPPKPFTEDEVGKILNYLYFSSKYRDLYPFIAFLFGTGCRIGEASALKWKHVDLNNRVVSIESQRVKKQDKAPKANSFRRFELTPFLFDLLSSLAQRNHDPNDYVFTWRCKPIETNNFASQKWKKILSDLGIEYRKPYMARHTFISHCLSGGVSPMTIAGVTGHSPLVMYKHYVGQVTTVPKVPDWSNHEKV